MNPDPDPLRAAEYLVHVCQGLAQSLEGEVEPETIHQVAGRLVGAADVLGTVLRGVAWRAPGEVSIEGDSAFHWREADRGLMEMFSQLYLSIPASHPARQWFTDHEPGGGARLPPHAADS